MWRGVARAGGQQTRGFDNDMSAMDQVREFYKDVRVEFTKISWPTRGELRDSTIVVIVSVLLVAAFIGIVDQLLNISVGVIFR